MSKEVGRTILEPCCRPGGEGDWWGEQHKHCTGSHSLNGEEYIACDCECHKASAGLTLSLATPTPLQLPPMDDELRWILGRPNFTCMGIATRLRNMGQKIKTRAEDEQAAVIYWMVNLYLKHGENWRDEAEKVLKAEAVRP